MLLFFKIGWSPDIKRPDFSMELRVVGSKNSKIIKGKYAIAHGITKCSLTIAESFVVIGSVASTTRKFINSVRI